MKTVIALIAAVLVVATPSEAAEQKVGLIDLRRVFDAFWKTKEADKRLKDEAAQLDVERKSMLDDYKKIEENYKKILDSANDPAISNEEKEKRKKTSEGELLKLKEIENKVQQFDRQSRTALAEKQRRMRDLILTEIRDEVKDQARTANFNLVIDVAAETKNDTPVVLFNDGSNEITDAVLKKLNLNAPTVSPGLPALRDDKKP